ncbi:enoyl-CoA hydratase/isomerase family protein [Dactylosporangium sp. CA-092794]|uniref:enoyl-CoA hydratase/isomerase family protein n=1 Tax=Dactylosporangium sp. CA-092794 TaxID=3239929 RepID=UPI003D8F7E62
MDVLAVADLERWLSTAQAAEGPHGSGSCLVVVDLATTGSGPPADLAAQVRGLPAVLVGVSEAADPVAGTVEDLAAGSEPYASVMDVVVTAARLPALVAAVQAHPLAATALALLLRCAPSGIDAGLVAESTTYSMLQAGPEFAAWRAARPPRTRSDRGPAVLVERYGDELRVKLNRPEVRNALNARMRDELVQALTIAANDPDLTVRLEGAGPSFCAGGDLDEFGSRADPASAHVIRLTRSPARLLSRLAARVTVHLHGACYGSGIELPAFAGRVVAAPDTRIALPELALGLIPGAGGTVSLPRRIGRRRTAWLAFTGEPIDAGTARRWGLVDAVEPA